MLEDKQIESHPAAALPAAGEKIKMTKDKRRTPLKLLGTRLDDQAQTKCLTTAYVIY